MPLASIYKGAGRILRGEHRAWGPRILWLQVTVLEARAGHGQDELHVGPEFKEAQGVSRPNIHGRYVSHFGTKMSLAKKR